MNKVFFVFWGVALLHYGIGWALISEDRALGVALITLGIAALFASIFARPSTFTWKRKTSLFAGLIVSMLIFDLLYFLINR